MLVDAHGMPVRAIITKGTTADCKKASELIDGIKTKALLADKAYDTNKILNQAKKRKIKAVILPKKKRKYDKELYKLRHLIENAFLRVKRWRGIATRYAKNSASFLAAIHIRFIHIWGNIL